MLFLPMVITTAWAEQEKTILKSDKKGLMTKFCTYECAKYFKKIKKIVLIMVFAATHALFYSLDIKIVTLLKRVRTPVALN